MTRSWERHQSKAQFFPLHISDSSSCLHFQKSPLHTQPSLHQLHEVSLVATVSWRQRTPVLEDTAPLRIHTLPGLPGKWEPHRDNRETLGSHHEDSRTWQRCAFSTHRGFNGPLSLLPYLLGQLQQLLPRLQGVPRRCLVCAHQPQGASPDLPAPAPAPVASWGVVPSPRATQEVHVRVCPLPPTEAGLPAPVAAGAQHPDNCPVCPKSLRGLRKQLLRSDASLEAFLYPVLRGGNGSC